MEQSVSLSAHQVQFYTKTGVLKSDFYKSRRTFIANLFWKYSVSLDSFPNKTKKFVATLSKLQSA